MKERVAYKLTIVQELPHKHRHLRTNIHKGTWMWSLRRGISLSQIHVLPARNSAGKEGEDGRSLRQKERGNP